VGYVLEALQINSQKLFWGVTLVFLPMVARMFSMVFHYKSTILGVLPIYGEPKSPRFGDVKVDVSPGPHWPGVPWTETCGHNRYRTHK
jgi:hypothetical protein